MIEKHILEQYTDMQEEHKDLLRRIQRLDDQIAKMEESGYTVADSVACGKKGKKAIRTVKVEGFPHPDYERKRALLRRYKAKLKLFEEDLLEKQIEVEEYIQSIEDSRIRRIMRYRYLDNLTWQQVAHRMGKHHTAEGCRSAHDRFLGIKK
mgnify:CR=1 FL=1